MSIVRGIVVRVHQSGGFCGCDKPIFRSRRTLPGCQGPRWAVRLPRHLSGHLHPAVWSVRLFATCPMGVEMKGSVCSVCVCVCLKRRHGTPVTDHAFNYLLAGTRARIRLQSLCGGVQAFAGGIVVDHEACQGISRLWCVCGPRRCAVGPLTGLRGDQSLLLGNCLSLFEIRTSFRSPPVCFANIGIPCPPERNLHCNAPE